jgi:dCMP deaminase
MRQSWTETWLKTALVIAERSRCVNRSVGAVIVDANNRIISTGYNGAPAKHVSSKSAPVCAGVCPRGGSTDRGSVYDNCIAIHAEANALLFADRSLLEGGTIFVSSPPCFGCAKLIANSGLVQVVARIGENDRHTDNEANTKFLESCGIKVTTIPEGEIKNDI